MLSICRWDRKSLGRRLANERFLPSVVFGRFFIDMDCRLAFLGCDERKRGCKIEPREYSFSEEDVSTCRRARGWTFFTLPSRGVGALFTSELSKSRNNGSFGARCKGVLLP